MQNSLDAHSCLVGVLQCALQQQRFETLLGRSQDFLGMGNPIEQRSL
jgi:hypothetical protein